MPLSRRDLFTLPVALAAGALLPSTVLAGIAARTPPLPDLTDWEAVRASFALDPSRLHFASFFLASHPRPVRDAIAAYRDAMDADPYAFVERAMFEGDDTSLPLLV